MVKTDPTHQKVPSQMWQLQALNWESAKHQRQSGVTTKKHKIHK